MSDNPVLEQMKSAATKEKVLEGKAKAPKKDLKNEVVPEAEKAKPGSDRALLEQIAQGQPLETVFNPPETLPSREALSPILSEANTLLLDMHDPRLLLSALATQAEDLPLGNELRIETVRMLSAIQSDAQPPEFRARVKSLQEKITALGIPQIPPQESHLVHVVENYNAPHPKEAVPEVLIEQLKSGTIDAAQGMAELLQKNTGLAADIWQGITGQEGFTGLDITPERILKLAELDLTPENIGKAEAIFATVKVMKESPFAFLNSLGTPLVVSMMGVMFLTQIATGEGGGGH